MSVADFPAVHIVEDESDCMTRTDDGGVKRKAEAEAQAETGGGAAKRARTKESGNGEWGMFGVHDINAGGGETVSAAIEADDVTGKVVEVVVVEEDVEEVVQSGDCALSLGESPVAGDGDVEVNMAERDFVEAEPAVEETVEAASGAMATAAAEAAVVKDSGGSSKSAATSSALLDASVSVAFPKAGVPPPTSESLSSRSAADPPASADLALPPSANVEAEAHIAAADRAAALAVAPLPPPNVNLALSYSDAHISNGNSAHTSQDQLSVPPLAEPARTFPVTLQPTGPGQRTEAAAASQATPSESPCAPSAGNAVFNPADEESEFMEPASQADGEAPEMAPLAISQVPPSALSDSQLVSASFQTDIIVPAHTVSAVEASPLQPTYHVAQLPAHQPDIAQSAQPFANTPVAAPEAMARNSLPASSPSESWADLANAPTQSAVFGHGIPVSVEPRPASTVSPDPVTFPSEHVQAAMQPRDVALPTHAHAPAPRSVQPPSPLQAMHTEFPPQDAVLAIPNVNTAIAYAGQMTVLLPESSARTAQGLKIATASAVHAPRSVDSTPQSRSVLSSAAQSMVVTVPPTFPSSLSSGTPVGPVLEPSATRAVAALAAPPLGTPTVFILPHLSARHQSEIGATLAGPASMTHAGDRPGQQSVGTTMIRPSLVERITLPVQQLEVEMAAPASPLSLETVRTANPVHAESESKQAVSTTPSSLGGALAHSVDYIHPATSDDFQSDSAAYLQAAASAAAYAQGMEIGTRGTRTSSAFTRQLASGASQAVGSIAQSISAHAQADSAAPQKMVLAVAEQAIAAQRAQQLAGAVAPPPVEQQQIVYHTPQPALAQNGARALQLNASEAELPVLGISAMAAKTSILRQTKATLSGAARATAEKLLGVTDAAKLKMMLEDEELRVYKEHVERCKEKEPSASKRRLKVFTGRASVERKEFGTAVRRVLIDLTLQQVARTDRQPVDTIDLVVARITRHAEAIAERKKEEAMSSEASASRRHAKNEGSLPPAVAAAVAIQASTDATYQVSAPDDRGELCPSTTVPVVADEGIAAHEGGNTSASSAFNNEAGGAPAPVEYSNVATEAGDTICISESAPESLGADASMPSSFGDAVMAPVQGEGDEDLKAGQVFMDGLIAKGSFERQKKNRGSAAWRSALRKELYEGYKRELRRALDLRIGCTDPMPALPLVAPLTRTDDARRVGKTALAVARAAAGGLYADVTYEAQYFETSSEGQSHGVQTPVQYFEPFAEVHPAPVIGGHSDGYAVSDAAICAPIAEGQIHSEQALVHQLEHVDMGQSAPVSAEARGAEQTIEGEAESSVAGACASFAAPENDLARGSVLAQPMGYVSLTSHAGGEEQGPVEIPASPSADAAPELSALTRAHRIPIVTEVPNA